MTRFPLFLATTVAIGASAAPAAAQYYPQPSYPQAYPQPVYPQQYPQQSYPGYNQGYSTGNPVTDIIDQLLGNRYSVTDRQAVRTCSNAARVRASQSYGGYGYNPGYGQGYGQGGYNGYGQQFAAPSMRVTAITNVERRSNGLRVSGLMSSSYAGQYGNQYGGQYAYQNRGYGDVSFRCNVDYRGAVTNIRIGRSGDYRR
jgi:hypothetical protein